MITFYRKRPNKKPRRKRLIFNISAPVDCSVFDPALFKKTSSDERIDAINKLSKLPKNSSPCRLRNRCIITGRPRGNYRKFKLSRIAFRELASDGKLPGITKSSW